MIPVEGPPLFIKQIVAGDDPGISLLLWHVMNPVLNVYLALGVFVDTDELYALLMAGHGISFPAVFPAV